MGTRSRIGIENEDGTITSVYCHWDGYLSGNGKILLEHWSNRDKLRQMMELGDMSSLGEELGEVHDFDARPQESVCTFYGRDRGEGGVGVAALVSPNRHSFPGDFAESYNYLYTLENEWIYNKGNGWFQTLTEAAVLADG